jgi:hypothetical protein
MSPLSLKQVLAASLAFVTATPSLWADCGQIPIIRRVNVNVNVDVVVSNDWYPPPTRIIRVPVPPPLISTTQTQTQTQSQTQITRGGGGIPVYRGDDPEWDTVAAAKAVGKGIRTFKEPKQYAVIGWDGSEQILVLMTEQQAFKGEGAALSVLPLPGEPIEIKEGDKELFANASAEIAKRLVGAAKKPVIAEARIGAHNIFVIEAESTDQFVKEVEEYVTNKFGENAQPLLTGHIRETIQHYVGQGFRYFAFDLILNKPELEVKQAIQYRFKSDYVYYPLYVSRLGGTGDTMVEAVVFTKGAINQVKRGALPDSQINTTRAVAFTQEELNALSPDLGNLMGAGGAQGRKWTIEGEISSFTGDVMMRN